MSNTTRFSTLLSLFVLCAIHASTMNAQNNVQAIVDQVKATDCSKFGADSAQTVTKYSLYREFYKQKNYEDAIGHWRYVFFNAPKLRETTHQNGADMYQKMIKELPKDQRGPYVDTLLAIYDVRLHCYGEKGDVIARKAYDYYRFRKSESGEILKLFARAHEVWGNDMIYNYFKPWIKTAVVADQEKGIITPDDVMDIFDKIGQITEYNVEGGNKASKYDQALQDATKILFEKGYLNCDRLVPYAEEKFKADPESNKNLKDLYSKLKSARCTKDPIFMEILMALNAQDPSAFRSRIICQNYMDQDRYQDAIAECNKAAELELDNDKKAEDLLNVAKIYRKLNNFSESRSYARKASELRPSWGEPYILIGKLYASSGKLCGPGTGWDSQVVTWPALDMFAKAKAMDPAAADEAQQLINKYSAYMPSKGDVFMRNLKEGASYQVGCWIGVSTTVRYGPS